MMSIAGATMSTSAMPQSVQKIPARMRLWRGLDTTTHRKDPAGDSAYHETAREVRQEADREQQQSQFGERMDACSGRVAERAVER